MLRDQISAAEIHNRDDLKSRPRPGAVAWRRSAAPRKDTVSVGKAFAAEAAKA